MLTAHLPSGYILARACPKDIPWVIPVAVVGAVLPDLDMLFFYFVDNRAFHHHYYWVHLPVFWLAVAVIALPVLHRLGYLRTGLVFFAAVLLHLLLDTIGGGIAWLLPFDRTLIELVTVPATQSNWILSFLLHWTFLLEIAIWITAGMLLWTRPKDSLA